MKIVIAPDSFKESLTASQAAAAMEEGFSRIFPDAHYRLLPIADGGEGTVTALLAAMGGERRYAAVRDPLGRTIDASFGITTNGTAVIEIASACGLHLLLPTERDPCLTSSYGAGQLVSAALDAGARRFIIGLGGSATNDGGLGFLQALGVRFLAANGAPLGSGGATLAELAKIDIRQRDPRLAESHFDVACDVDNPLVGPHGASAIFGPQKGATTEMVATLDKALRRFAAVLRRDLAIDRDIEEMPGGGAAGGLGTALSVVLGGRQRPGIEIVAEALALEREMEGADLVLTGEGRVDGQTSRGKAPAGVAAIARRCGVPVIALGGAVGHETEKLREIGIDAVFGAVRAPCTLEQALSNAYDNLRISAENVAATLQLGCRMR